jgi:hypothetical protein
MSLNIEMSTKVLKSLETAFQKNTAETTRMLAERYGFDAEEALRSLNIGETVKIVKGKKKGTAKVAAKEKKEKKAEPKMVLPFCGRVVEEWCEGVKQNHGLYSQCTSEKTGEKYCKTCKKQAEKNGSGKPTLGEISERMGKSSEAYREEKGKKCVVYAVVMKKLKIEKEEACAEAKKFGLEIPAEEFELPKSHRGRPKKLSESESVKSEDGEKKRRGRPKKNKTVAENETDETDDLIASLVAEANALKGSAEASETEACETDGEEASETDGEEASETDGEEACASASEAEASEAEEEESEESKRERLLKQITEKLSSDETYNKLSEMVVAKKDKKQHLTVMGEHIKKILTEEELELYTGVPEVVEIEAAIEAAKKEEEAAEKKAHAEAEKQKKKAEAEAEKLKKKAEADAEKLKKKAEADAEKQKKKEEAEAEKQKKKEEADAEKLKKKEEADAEKLKKKAEADLEKKPAVKKTAEKKAEEKKPAEKKEKKPAEKKEKKPAQVKPVEKEPSEELQEDVVEAEPSEADASEAEPSEAEPSEAVVNAKVFEYEGKKYLKTEEGILYDQATEECVGVWNEETKSIDDFADEED